jgi:hypothetical protein
MTFARVKLNNAKRPRGSNKLNFNGAHRGNSPRQEAAEKLAPDLLEISCGIRSFAALTDTGMRVSFEQKKVSLVAD